MAVQKDFNDRFVGPEQFFKGIIQKDILQKVYQVLQNVKARKGETFKVYYKGLETKTTIKKLYVIVDMDLKWTYFIMENE